jgi:hypothetical protein
LKEKKIIKLEKEESKKSKASNREEASTRRVVAREEA